MKLEARIKADWNKGEFANLRSPDGKHKLELSWYADDSPVARPFHEGDELDHLGFEVEDFDRALARLQQEGYTPGLGPFHVEKWHIAYVPVVEGIWIDVYQVDREPERSEASRKARRNGVRRKRRR